MTDKDLNKLAKLIVKELKDEIIKELTTELDETFDIQQAASYLKISKDYLYKILPQVPHSQKVKGGKLIFHRSQLDKYMNNR